MLLLGIGMSASNPRHASNWNLLFALLGFFAYYNFINLSQAWVGARPRRPRHGAARRCTAARSCSRWRLLWWRENGMRARRRARRAGVGAAPRAQRRRMRTVRRLFYVDIVSAVVFVALAFLALFFFIDFVDELRDVGTRGYSAAQPRSTPAAGARRTSTS